MQARTRTETGSRQKEDGGITYKGQRPKIVNESNPYAGVVAGKGND